MDSAIQSFKVSIFLSLRFYEIFLKAIINGHLVNLKELHQFNETRLESPLHFVKREHLEIPLSAVDIKHSLDCQKISEVASSCICNMIK